MTEIWYKYSIPSYREIILKGKKLDLQTFLKVLLFCVKLFKYASCEINVYVLAKWVSSFRKTCSIINSLLSPSFIRADICSCLFLCGFMAKLFLKLEVLPFQ